LNSPQTQSQATDCRAPRGKSPSSRRPGNKSRLSREKSPTPFRPWDKRSLSNSKAWICSKSPEGAPAYSGAGGERPIRRTPIAGLFRVRTLEEAEAMLVYPMQARDIWRRLDPHPQDAGAPSTETKSLNRWRSPARTR
jgi:hypothetical protein